MREPSGCDVRAENHAADTDIAIDEAYVEEWAERWEVADRWQEARARRG